MNSPKPATLSNRKSKEVGKAARGLVGGPGGSSTPTPGDIRGGPPERAEDGFGSNSSSHCRNSYDIQKGYRHPPLAFKLDVLASEQTKHSFDRDPSGHGMPGAVPGGNKLPAAHGFHGALVQPKTDALNDANILCPPIRSHEDLQRHRALNLAVSRLVRVCRIRTIGASRSDESRSIRAIGSSDPCGAVVAIPESSFRACADAVFVARAGRVRVIWHPWQAEFFSLDEEWQPRSDQEWLAARAGLHFGFAEA